MSEQLPLEFEDTPAVPSNCKECPAPGIYRDVPFEEYSAWQAVNSSVVKWGLKTPKHMAAAFNGELKSDDTKDRRLGRAIHCMTLEPSEFSSRFVVAGKCVAELKSGASKGLKCNAPGKYMLSGEWYCGKHGESDIQTGIDVITEDEMRRTLGVVESLKHLPDELKPMLSRAGWSEVSVVFEYQGLKFKGRMDRFSDGKTPMIIDLKKVQVGAGGREECQKAILRYRYDVQAAIYCKGIEFLLGKTPEFAWLFVEDNSPFDLQVIPASEEDIQIGWRSCQAAVRNYISSVPDCWGYIRMIENVKTGGLPPWFVQQEREKYAV